MGRVAKKLVATPKCLIRPQVFKQLNLPKVSDAYQRGPSTVLVELKPGHIWRLPTDGIMPFYIYQGNKSSFKGHASKKQTSTGLVSGS